MLLRKYAFALGLCMLWGTHAVAHDLSVSDREQQVTAKIVMEFPRYVRGAAFQNAPTLCIAGNEEFLTLVRALNEQQVTYGRVLPFNDNISSCSFLYAENIKSAHQLIAAAAAHQVLTISNYHNFIDEGGAIGVVNNNGIMSIELNLSVASEKHATFSPDLIELSQRVIQ